MTDVYGSDSEDNNDSDISIEEEESGQRTVRVKRNAAHDEFSTYMKKLDGGKQELRSQCKHCSKYYTGKNLTTKNLEMGSSFAVCLFFFFHKRVEIIRGESTRDS